MFDRNNNAAILLAGILALVVGVGVARFAFTSLLPTMLENHLNIAFAGMLASVNYVGYLSGSIFSIFIKDIHAKVKFFRLGLVLCIITSLLLALTQSQIIWLIARLLAGFGAAMALVVGSAIVMSKLQNTNKTKAMGIHFSGLGFSILVSDLIMRATFNFSDYWQHAWLVLAIAATVFASYSAYILSFDKQNADQVVKHKFDKALFSPLVVVLALAYFTEGVGMVVQATFLPDIVNSLPGLAGYGGYAWLAVGLAGIPSCIIWMRLAHRYNSIDMMILAMALQVIGILIPIFSNNIILNLISGILYGATFIGLVALFMNFAGQLAGKNPVFIMGIITAAYGVGQVVAPLYCVVLIEQFGNYNAALYVTAIIVVTGIILLKYTKIRLLSNNHTAISL